MSAARKESPVTTELVQVPFHGETLYAAKDENGEVWVSIKRVCEAMGVSIEGQLSKLKTKQWAVMKMIFMTGPDGKNYETSCISLDALPMWLATIEVSRVAENIRPKLVAFQLEAARALRDHFFKKPSAPPPPSFDTQILIDALAAVLPPVLMRVVAPIHERIDKLEERLNGMSEHQGVIGARAGKRIRAQLQTYASLMGDTPGERKSWLGEGQMSLRGELSFSGPSTSWDYLPIHKHGDALLALAKMIGRAEKIYASRARDRQQVISFPRSALAPAPDSKKNDAN